MIPPFIPFPKTDIEQSIPQRFEPHDLESIQPDACIHHLGRKNDKGERIKPETHGPPKSHTEILRANIWSQILKRPSIGHHDDFFDCGGKSIAAIQIQNRIRVRFAINRSIADIFDNRTLDGLSKFQD